MKVLGLKLTTENIITALGLPSDCAIIRIDRESETLDFNIVIQGNSCEEKPEYGYITYYYYAFKDEVFNKLSITESKTE